MRTIATVLLMIGTAAAYGCLLAYLRVPAMLVEGLQGASDKPIVILLLLLLLGTFMDMSPLIVITTPIFLPVAQAFGVDPVYFGSILILNLGIGVCTPPVGAALFFGRAVGKIPVGQAVGRSGPSTRSPSPR